jgi:hypothetical protein
MVVRVNALIEIDIETVFENIIEEYEYENAEDITMDDVSEYVCNNVTYLKGKKGIEEVADGPAIDGFEERDYEKIEKQLEEYQERN